MNCSNCKYMFFCDLVEKVVDDWENSNNKKSSYFYEQMLVRTISSKIRRELCKLTNTEDR